MVSADLAQSPSMQPVQMMVVTFFVVLIAYRFLGRDVSRGPAAAA